MLTFGFGIDSDLEFTTLWHTLESVEHQIQQSLPEHFRVAVSLLVFARKFRLYAHSNAVTLVAGESKNRADKILDVNLLELQLHRSGESEQFAHDPVETSRAGKDFLDEPFSRVMVGDIPREQRGETLNSTERISYLVSHRGSHLPNRRQPIFLANLFS